MNRRGAVISGWRLAVGGWRLAVGGWRLAKISSVTAGCLFNPSVRRFTQSSADRAPDMSAEGVAL